MTNTPNLDRVQKISLDKLQKRIDKSQVNCEVEGLMSLSIGEWNILAWNNKETEESKSFQKIFEAFVNAYGFDEIDDDVD